MNKNSYTNPILYTDYSDPDAIRVGDDYFMISSSFSNVPGIPILHSRDLIHWQIINYVLDCLPDERYEKPVHGCGVWAPSIRFHEGIFYVCFPMPDEGIYMCTSTDPFKKWSDPVNIRPGAGWIDPCPFWDDDGKAYLVAGVAKSRIGYKSVLHIVEMRPDGLGLIGPENKIFDGNKNNQETIEGPKLYKRNGYYYIFAPAGGVKTGWQTVLRSKNIWGPYEYKVVMRQENTSINGPHQGAWVDTPDGRDYFIHFQDVYSAGRIVHLQPMKWVDDWPIIGEQIEGKDYGRPVLEWERPFDSEEEQNYTYPSTDDDFLQNKLGLQWQWNANPHEKFYKIENETLYLFAQNKLSVYADAANLLLQKWPAKEFACITKIDISNLTVGDEAGIISLGTEYGVITVERTTESFKLSRVFGKQNFGKILVDHTDEEKQVLKQFPLDNNMIYFKYIVESDGYQDLSPSEKGFPKEKVSVSYSFDDIEYKEALCMKAVPGRWVGVKNGVFCLSDNQASRGFAKVLSVKYHNIYHNPVKRGFFPDPSVVRVGHDYYMVNSTFQYFPAIPISHSTDMVNWEIIGHAITNPDYLDISDIKDSHGIWAPDIEYVDGMFIIMATLRLNGTGQRGNNVLRRQIVVTSSQPEGPYSKPSFIEVDDIDPSLFVDDDGSKYMLISPGVNLVSLSDDCLEQRDDKICIWEGTGERCPEGPHLFRRGEYYYAVLAEGGTGYGHGINVARSKKLTGPYEPSPYNPVLRQTDMNANLQRCGHGKFIEDHNGNWWVYYLCGRPNQGHYTTIGRETALEPVRWLDDGWFIVNEGNGPSSVNLAPDLTPDFVPVSSKSNAFEFFDDFDKDKLGMEWEFVRLPNKGNYSLTDRHGYFRIWTMDGQLFEIRAKNTLLLRETELSYKAETKLDFNPTRDGEQAGLVCYYSTATYARCSICYENGRKIQLVINRNCGEEIICEIDNIAKCEIYLRVEVILLKRSFFYSYDGVTWMEIGVLSDCVYLCDEGVPDDPKRHTGTLVGIYANNGGCGSRIPADFDYFRKINL